MAGTNSNKPSERRGFLRGLVSLPLVGGGLSLNSRSQSPRQLAEQVSSVTWHGLRTSMPRPL